MKVRVHFSGSSMGIFIISGAGTTRIGDQSFRSDAVSARKADMFRRVFREEEEYEKSLYKREREYARNEIYCRMTK
jgi:tyrosyl-tRNA synthetase